jgi:hypothetical protein
VTDQRTEDGTVQPLPDKDENVQKWVKDWSDEYGQHWTEDQLHAFVGKKVHAERPARSDEDGPKGIEATIIGYSIDRVLGSDTDAYRHSLISDEGLSFPLFTGMTVEVVE